VIVETQPNQEPTSSPAAGEPPLPLPEPDRRSISLKYFKPKYCDRFGRRITHDARLSDIDEAVEIREDGLVEVALDENISRRKAKDER